MLLSEDHRMIRDAVRDFVAAELAPGAAQRDREASFPREALRGLAALGCYGILRLTLLKDVMIMSGVGVGGGSLGYACTLYEPPDTFFRDPQWAGVTDWKAELAPYYDQAKRMLGVTGNPVLTASDHALKAVAAAE